MKRTLHYCYFIQLAFLFSIILFDHRASTIANPSSVIRAISIAVSYLIYDIKGYAGLVEIYDIVNEIFLSHWRTGKSLGFFIDNYTEYKEFVFSMNQQLFEATQATINNEQFLHGYYNDIGYVYFVIVAFKIFGFQVQSLSLLFATIITITSLFFYFSLKDNDSAIYVLVCLISVIIFAILFVVFGEDDQLASVTNPRSMSILALIPTANIILLIMQKNKNTFIFFLTLIIQTLILLFIILIRSTALWALVSLFIFFILSLFFLKFKNIGLKKSILLLIIPCILFVSNSLFNKYAEKNSHEIYRTDILSVKHAAWHTLLIGITADRNLWLKHVCFDPPMEEKLLKFKTYSCNEVNKEFPYKSRFLNYIDGNSYRLQNFNDDFPTHSGIKYLRDTNQPLNKLGPTNLFPNKEILKKFPLESKYQINYLSEQEKILKNVLFNIIKSDPLDFIIVTFIYKPVTFFYQICRTPLFVIESVIRSKSPFITIGLFLILIINYFYATRYFIRKRINKEKILLLLNTTLIFSTSIVPLLFYPSPASIIDTTPVILFAILTIIIPNFVYKKFYE